MLLDDSPNLLALLQQVRLKLVEDCATLRANMLEHIVSDLRQLLLVTFALDVKLGQERVRATRFSDTRALLRFKKLVQTQR